MSTIVDHPNIPSSAANRCSWTTACWSAESRLSAEAVTGASRGQGPGQPMPDTPHRGCPRRGLRPNPDCFEHLLSRASLPRPLGAAEPGSGLVRALNVCKTPRTRGSSCAGLPRRRPTLTTQGAFRLDGARKRAVYTANLLTQPDSLNSAFGTTGKSARDARAPPR